MGLGNQQSEQKLKQPLCARTVANTTGYRIQVEVECKKREID